MPTPIKLSPANLTRTGVGPAAKEVRKSYEIIPQGLPISLISAVVKGGSGHWTTQQPAAFVFRALYASRYAICFALNAPLRPQDPRGPERWKQPNPTNLIGGVICVCAAIHYRKWPLQPPLLCVERQNKERPWPNFGLHKHQKIKPEVKRLELKLTCKNVAYCPRIAGQGYGIWAH